MKLVLLFLALFLLPFKVFSGTIINQQLVLSVTDTSQKALDANLSRGYLMVQNNGNGNIYLKFDSAHTGTEGIVIVGGGSWEPSNCPFNSIYLKSDTTETNSIVILEGGR